MVEFIFTSKRYQGLMFNTPEEITGLIRQGWAYSEWSKNFNYIPKGNHSGHDLRFVTLKDATVLQWTRLNYQLLFSKGAVLIDLTQRDHEKPSLKIKLFLMMNLKRYFES